MNDCTTRICSDCGQEYPLTKEYFRYQKDKSGKYYFQHRCINCRRMKEREYYKEIDGAAKMSEWRKEHPDKYKAAKRRYAERHPDKVKAMKQRERKKNAEGYRQRGLKWRLADPERAKDRANQNYRRMKARHPGYIRQTNESRLYRMINAGGPIDKELALELYNEQEGRCAYCGISVYHSIDRDVHVEHILPISRGGTNDRDNLVITCGHCNWSKGNKTLAEWQAVRGW